MDNLALEHIKNINAYSPPLDGRSSFEGLLLDFNERTVPVNPSVISEINKYLIAQKTQVYPEYFKITKELANYAKVKPEEIIITNGGDQGIDLIFRTYTRINDPVIIPSPSFAMFYQCAQITGNKMLEPTYLKMDLAYPFEEVLEMIKPGIKLVIICNPNNPTGTMLDLEKVKIILKKCLSSQIFVLVDEAYYEYTHVTAAPLINLFPNMAIVRTFSKPFGMPALRFAYILSAASNIKEMLKVRGPYDVNVVSVIAASAALKDTSYVKRYTDEIMNKSKPMVEKFFDEIKMKYFPSKANFILIKPTDSLQLYEKLKKNGILTRPRSGPNIENTLRVSIGTVEQMESFISIFKKLI